MWELLSGRVLDPFFVSSPTRDGSLKEATVKRFLDLGFEIEILTGARPSEKEGVLWTNEFVRLAKQR